MGLTISRTVRSWTWIVLLGALLVFCQPNLGVCSTYGFKDESGKFVPKMTVEVGDKEVVLKKKDPDEKFKSIGIKLNPRNGALIRNVMNLNIIWINQRNRPGKPLLFSGSRYDRRSQTYRDSMTQSIAVKVVDDSNRNLFVDKDFDDLFIVTVEGRRLVSADSFHETDRTVRSDVPQKSYISVDKKIISFTKENIRKGEFLNLDNRSGFNQTVGIELPDQNLFYYQEIIRRPEQSKVARENWGKFPMEADSGIFIVLIPDPDPLRLVQLNGKEISIKVFRGSETVEIVKVPIQISSDLTLQGSDAQTGAPGDDSTTEQAPAGQPPADEEASPKPETKQETDGLPSREGSTAFSLGGSLALWILLALSFILTVAVAGYGIFFVLPKIQVLEDRLAKNEMFIHGSREAIREELELTKEEILKQCLKDTPAE